MLCSKLKKILLTVWAVIASVCAVAEFILLRKRDRKTIEEKAQNARDKTKEEIEQTSGGDLVDAACNANELRGERESIAERFRAEVRNRLNEKLHGEGSPSAH